MASSNQILKRKFWKVFSEYIRRRDADEFGMVSCISCGKRMHWKEADAGHYIAKTGGLSIYFSETNVNCQCTGCNRYRHGNLAQYALALRRKYGEQILEKLEYDRRQLIQIHDNEYIEFVKLYKDKIKQLCQ